MAETRQYNSFEGGINNSLPPYIIESDQYESFYWAEDCINMSLRQEGIIKDEGYTSILTANLGAAGQGLFSYNGDLLACAGGKIYLIDPTAGTSTEKHTGANATAFWDATAYANVLVLCNGVDSPLQWNGTTVTSIAYTDPNTVWNSAKPKGSAEFRGRLYYWGDPTNPHKS